MTHLPLPSITFAPLGTGVEAAGPTAWMRSPSMTTVASRSMAPPASRSGCTTFACTIAVTAAWLGRARASAASGASQRRECFVIAGSGRISEGARVSPMDDLRIRALLSSDQDFLRLRAGRRAANLPDHAVRLR